MRSHPTIKSALRSGGIVPLALGAVLVTGLVLISAGSTWTWSNSRARSRMLPARSMLMDQPTALQVEVALRTAGLTPETLAAAGLSQQDVASLVSAGRTYLNNHEADLDAATNAAGSARNDRDRLQRLVESGLASENDVAALGTAQTNLASATASRDSILSALYSAAVAGLTNGQRAVLSELKSNGAWDLPTQYLAVNRGQADWVDLRENLANLRIAGELGEDPDAGCQQAVNQANGDPAVSAAATNLSNGFATVSQAWATAIGG